VVPDLFLIVGQNDTLGITGVFLAPVTWQPMTCPQLLCQCKF